MRKKPFSTISVLGSKTKIFVDEIPEQENAIAMFLPGQDLILLDVNDDKLFQSFCHELFHLLAHRSGIKQTSLSSDVEEILAENFSVLMQENFDEIIKIRKKIKTHSAK